MFARKGDPAPDKAALAAVGKRVRERLALDGSVYRFPVETAEIYAVGDFLSASECDHIIGLIDRVAKPSELLDPQGRSEYRTSYSGDVEQGDSVVKMIERRLCDMLGIDIRWGETVQGQRYYEGQEFREHCDWFDPATEYWIGEVPRGGQRSWTAMAYLNDVEEGGDTEFTRIGMGVTPQRGALLLWNNATPEGLPNTYTMHAALPVKRGVKYVVTKWFRTRNWQ